MTEKVGGEVAEEVVLRVPLRGGVQLAGPRKGRSAALRVWASPARQMVAAESRATYPVRLRRLEHLEQLVQVLNLEQR